MKCPTCRAEMVWGRLGIVQEGVFFRAPGRQQVPIDQKTGFRCEECETVVICKSTPNDTEAPCLECGAVMAPGETVCAKCGWTYKDS
jgi:hypothetical protein